MSRMVKYGKGTKYAKKYVKVSQDELRHQIIPKAADECAKKRAELAWTPQQYRECLKQKIRELIQELNQ